MAGALAVELLASILQHPLGGLAPAETDPESTETGSELGMVPHSIRGFISHYQIVLPAVESFLSCVACSDKVLNSFDIESKCLTLIISRKFISHYKINDSYLNFCSFF